MSDLAGQLLGLQRAIQVTQCAECRANIRAMARRIAEVKCWCGGEVGLREPGDEHGLGCLSNVMHQWETT